MSVYGDIRAALETQVASVTGIPSAANRAWENVRFDPTTGITWVRLTLNPSRRRPQDVTATGLQRYDGLFLVDVFAPEHEGPGAAETLADAVVSAFDAGTVLKQYEGEVLVWSSEEDDQQTVEIEWAELSTSAIADSPWFQVPVTVKWKAFN